MWCDAVVWCGVVWRVVLCCDVVRCGAAARTVRDTEAGCGADGVGGRSKYQEAPYTAQPTVRVPLARTYVEERTHHCVRELEASLPRF